MLDLFYSFCDSDMLQQEKIDKEEAIICSVS